jgi:hypothetical protein
VLSADSDRSENFESLSSFLNIVYAETPAHLVRGPTGLTQGTPHYPFIGLVHQLLMRCRGKLLRDVPSSSGTPKITKSLYISEQ